MHNAVRASIGLAVEPIHPSPLIIEAVAAGHFRVVGGRYDLDSGAVEIML